MHSRETHGLLVELDGLTLLHSLSLTGFAPAPDWLFGFGARTGPNTEHLEERHDIRNVRVTIGASIGPYKVLSQISLNGQQYLGDASFHFYPRAFASAVLPASGPADGGTALTVHGSHLHGGSDYRCVFSRPDGTSRIQAAERR